MNGEIRFQFNNENELLQFVKRITPIEESIIPAKDVESGVESFVDFELLKMGFVITNLTLLDKVKLIAESLRQNQEKRKVMEKELHEAHEYLDFYTNLNSDQSLIDKVRDVCRQNSVEKG